MYPSKRAIVAIFIIGSAFCVIANAGLNLPARDSIQVDVSPSFGINTGAIYLKDVHILDDADFYYYVYKIKFKGFTADTIPTRVWLQISNESKEWNDPGILIENSKKAAEIEKKVNIANEVGEYLGNVRYRIISDPRNADESELYNSTGPEIIVNFKNEKFVRTGEDTYSYSVDVRSSLDWMDIYLYYKNSPDASWDYYSELQTYRNPTYNGSKTNGWVSVSWDDAPYFQKVEFAI